MTTIHVAIDGTVTYGMPVKHEAANIQCSAVIGSRRDPESGVKYDLICRRRAGHPTPKGEKRHARVDVRVVAASRNVVHEERYKPNLIPKGVDMNITLPHNCENHLVGF